MPLRTIAPPLRLLAGGVALALAAAPASAASYRVMYAFQGGSDGALPSASLLAVGGVLYGTTNGGGVDGCANDQGCGTVFRMTQRGSKTTLYSFNGGSDGQQPWGGLVNVGTALYGTTSYGGTPCGDPGCGAVFKLGPNGQETVLYSFAGSTGNDGTYPFAGLTNVGGTFYGTTREGGGTGCGSGCGSVFSLSPQGVETVLHAFQGGSDGAYPDASLVNINGTLYGTTEGDGSDCASGGCGTVFKVTKSGVKVVYTFQGGTDGAGPSANLVEFGGKLYGTTQSGGGANCGGSGCGTVFRIGGAGAEAVLHAFQGGDDGADPYAGLINVGGTFYGTTRGGGANGLGTVFKITPQGTETVVHAFKGGNDGVQPWGGLTYIGGMLYGTTVAGGGTGCGGFGCGTVFRVTP